MLKKSILLLIGVPILFVMFLGNNAMSANCENPDSLTFAMIPTERVQFWAAWGRVAPAVAVPGGPDC